MRDTKTSKNFLKSLLFKALNVSSLKQKSVQAQTDEENLDGTVMEAASDDEDEDSDKDFDYLMSMPMWSLTQEKKDELCRKR